MRLVALALLLLSTALARDEDTNEVNPAPPPIKLDANLRRALLKALTELENEENEKNNSPSRPIIGNLPHLDTRDKIIEKASASALSFYETTDAAETTTELLTTTTSTKPSILVQRSQGIQHKPITSIEKNQLDPVQDVEHFLTSASSNFAANKFTYSKNENPRSVINTASANLLGTADQKAPKVETTTIIPTTSTEEHEAKVEDVQFFSAPLVAAFTVHQDERGLPKSVEPIFRKVEKSKQEVKPAKNNQHLQVALQQKQRALEDEILRLKHQQQQHNYLIRQQQILHEQQLELQKNKLLEEQSRLRNNQQPFVPIVGQATDTRTKGSVVSFQPSISFTPNQQAGFLPINGQFLPTKSAVDFRTPQLTQQFQQLPTFGQQLSSFTLVPQPQLSLIAPKHNRVFRQEAGTGNFFNNNFNQNQGFNYFRPTPQEPNRFFRSNPEASFSTIPQNYNGLQPPAVNQQLNHLLYNSGFIGGNRQQEDLNIVSKVLSLNHYGSDFRLAGSNINERRIPAPLANKKAL